MKIEYGADVCRQVFHGDGVALVASLFETKPPTKDEIQKLEQLLAELRKSPPPKKGKP